MTQQAGTPEPTLTVRPPPLGYPMTLTRERLTAVTDACALASSAGHVVRYRAPSIIAALAWRGRPNVFVTENVEAELPKAIRQVAANMGLPVADVDRVMREQILPRIRVVPLAIGDYLHPRIAAIRSCDPDMPRSMRGDPDDLGTAALAEFLAPAVVISKDSVFNRFGLALPAGQWTEEVQRLLTAAGYEAELQGAAGTAELAARGIFAGIEAVSKAAARNPKATIAVLAVTGVAIWACSRRGWLTAEKVRQAGQVIVSVAKPIADRVVVAAEGQAETLGALTIVKRSSPITLEERCARHLAMRHAAMTPTELRDALSTYDRPMTAAAIRRAVRAHPAFARQQGDKYLLGRPVSLPALDGSASMRAIAPAAPSQHYVIPPPVFVYAVPASTAQPVRVRGENDR
jgi:hypothetical protein